MFLENIFNKKEEVLSDQSSVFHNREMPRFTSKAGIFIEGFEGEGLLKNVSETGCCLESVTYVAIKPSDEYQIKIVPAAGENTAAFTVKLRARIESGAVPSRIRDVILTARSAVFPVPGPAIISAIGSRDFTAAS